MKSTLLSALLCFAAGGLYALCYPSFLGNGWFPLLFISLPLFLWNLENSENLKQSLLFILCYNLGLNVVGYYWIPHTIREFGGLPYAASIITGVFFSFILQPHWWLYALWRKFKPAWQWERECGVLITAFIITFLERYIPQQFPSYAGSPWLHLKPFLGLTPYLGVVVFSFMTYWVCLEAITQLTARKFRSQVWIVFTAFILINTLFPLENPEKIKDLPIRMVQANVGNFMKVSSEKGEKDSYEAIIKKYYRLSTEGEEKPDLIIWPETAYPNTFFGNYTRLDQVFRNIMLEKDSEMLIGGYDQNRSTSPFDLYETVYNSSLLLSEGRVKTSYHKNILIPFGETLPFGPLNHQIVAFLPGVSLFALGDGTPLMETREKFRFVTPICYEILDSNFLRGLLNQWRDNHFIVNHTNDSWYGKTAEPYQHLFLSKWRALEFRLPIIRSTNTGISSVIYPDGSESKRLEIWEEGYLDINIPISDPQNTLYQLYGVYPMLGSFLLLLLITWLRERNENQL